MLAIDTFFFLLLGNTNCSFRCLCFEKCSAEVQTLYHLVRVLLKHSSELAQQKAGGDLKVGRGVVVKGGGKGASPQRVPQSRGFWGNGLTLNVDIAGSLLYLSMVWNLDEWLSSWYSSECLLRVCITF